MSRRPLSEASLPAIAGVARRALTGDVPDTEHEHGRRRALAAFAERRRSAPRVVAWLAAAAVTAVLLVILVTAWPRSPLRFTVDGAPAVAGAYVHARPDGVAAVRFSDGSVIGFMAGAAGRVADVGPHGARVLLESGKASVEVMHLPAAQWSVEAGPFAIAVIGTAFDVSWSSEAQALEVDLRQGAVRVRGPLAPNGIELRAGQRLVARVAEGEIHIGEIPPPAAVVAPDLPAPPVATAATEEPTPPPKPRARPPRRSPGSGAHEVRWPERVAAGDFGAVLKDADARGIDVVLREVPLADLVALADAARYSGRRDLAQRALLAQRERFPSTAEARAAAFLLGRLADDRGSTPTEALRWYDRYLAEAPQGAFAAEALGRKMMAMQRAHDPAVASIAAEYLRRYPSGAHAAAAREIAGP